MAVAVGRRVTVGHGDDGVVAAAAVMVAGGEDDAHNPAVGPGGGDELDCCPRCCRCW